jgi:4a-hydroxytetrahydrobiopterin dehydratase
MDILSDMHCTACDEQSKALTEEEIATWHPQVPNWEIAQSAGRKSLAYQYEVDDFAQALALANAIGALAEEEYHHPKLVVEWGQVSVQWWTQQVHGLHPNDFIMAAKTDNLYREGAFRAPPTDAIEKRSEDMREQTLQWWRDLTGNDLPDVEADRERLIQLLQDKYGCSEAEANDELGRRIDDYQRFVA